MGPMHKKRRPWIYLGVVLAGIGLLVVSVAWWLGWPEKTGPRTVADRAEVISFAIPEGWTDQTGSDARQIVPGDSGDGAARVPDIVVWKESRQEEDVVPVVLHVVLDVAPEGVDLRTLHEVSRGRSGSGEPGDNAASPVQQWRSLASSSSNGSSKVVTVLSDTFVVSIYAYADDLTSMREADQVIASLKINDEW